LKLLQRFGCFFAKFQKLVIFCPPHFGLCSVRWGYFGRPSPVCVRVVAAVASQPHPQVAAWKCANINTPQFAGQRKLIAGQPHVIWVNRTRASTYVETVVVMDAVEAFFRPASPWVKIPKIWGFWK
jgi:hypothetical protein